MSATSCPRSNHATSIVHKRKKRSELTTGFSPGNHVFDILVILDDDNTGPGNIAPIPSTNKYNFGRNNAC